MKATLAWLERSAAEARVQDAVTERLVRTGGHPGVHRDVAVVPEPGLDGGDDIRGVVDLDLLDADHRPPPSAFTPRIHARAFGRDTHSVTARHLAIERVRRPRAAASIGASNGETAETPADGQQDAKQFLEKRSGWWYK